jgi:hypothetical protein
MFVEPVITLPIYACLLVLCAYLVIYVLGFLGVALFPKVVQITWLIVVMVGVLMIVRMLLPGISKMRIGSGMPPLLT